MIRNWSSLVPLLRTRHLFFYVHNVDLLSKDNIMAYGHTMLHNLLLKRKKLWLRFNYSSGVGIFNSLSCYTQLNHKTHLTAQYGYKRYLVGQLLGLHLFTTNSLSFVNTSFTSFIILRTAGFKILLSQVWGRVSWLFFKLSYNSNNSLIKFLLTNSELCSSLVTSKFFNLRLVYTLLGRSGALLSVPVKSRTTTRLGQITFNEPHSAQLAYTRALSFVLYTIINFILQYRKVLTSLILPIIV
jgi:hypothetical protein